MRFIVKVIKGTSRVVRLGFACVKRMVGTWELSTGIPFVSAKPT
ncbi:hypothetical protein ACHAWC_004188 [Mediolabrus comicus]